MRGDYSDLNINNDFRFDGENMTIDEITTGGVAHIFTLGDISGRELQERSRLAQRKPEYFFTGGIGLPTLYQGMLGDERNIKYGALGNVNGRELINPSDPKLFIHLDRPMEVNLYNYDAAYKGQPLSKVYATSVFWHEQREGGSVPVKPAKVSELLEQYVRDGDLFRLTWQYIVLGRSILDPVYTTFMGKDDLGRVEEQLVADPGIITETIQHHFASLVGLIELKGPETVNQDHISILAEEHYQETLRAIESRNRRAIAQPPKPKRISFPFFKSR